MRDDRTVTNDQQSQVDAPTEVTVPTPRLALTSRYTPRVCAQPRCTLPPHTTWTVTTPGRAYDRWWETGDTLDLCGVHEQDNGQPARTIAPPAPRQRNP